MQNLPDWFDLKKYGGTKSLTLADWYANLNLRSQVFQWHTMLQIKHPFTEIHSAVEACIPRINSLLTTITQETLIKARPISSLRTLSKTVKSITNLEAYQMNELMRLRRPENLSKYIERGDIPITGSLLSIDDEDVEIFLKSALVKPQSGIEYAAINLNASNEQILSDFKTWLINFRKTSPDSYEKKSFNDFDLNQWHTHKILPYLDLVIWGALMNEPFSQASLGETLFPGATNIDTTEKIRKTTKPTAESAISNKILGAMIRQIELEERNQTD